MPTSHSSNSLSPQVFLPFYNVGLAQKRRIFFANMGHFRRLGEGGFSATSDTKQNFQKSAKIRGGGNFRGGNLRHGPVLYCIIFNYLITIVIFSIIIYIIYYKIIGLLLPPLYTCLIAWGGSILYYIIMHMVYIIYYIYNMLHAMLPKGRERKESDREEGGPSTIKRHHLKKFSETPSETPLWKGFQRWKGGVSALKPLSEGLWKGFQRGFQRFFKIGPLGPRDPKK